MFYILFLFSCSAFTKFFPPEQPPPEAESDYQDVLQQPEPAAEAARYQGEQIVQASKLLFRDAPNSTATVLGELPINTHVNVLDYDGDWCKVEALNGVHSWVRCLYLGPFEVDSESIREQLKTEMDVEKKLHLWQRLASLEPQDPKTLVHLAVAYEHAGQVEITQKMTQSFGEQSGIFGHWFKPHKVRAVAITSEIQKSKIDQDLIKTWTKATTLCDEITPRLEAWYIPQKDDYTAYLPPPFEATLDKQTPWATLNQYAEGTVLVLEVNGDLWLQAAQRTSGELDDKFFQLLLLAYEGLSTKGWAAWMMRNWDYGGISPFGDGNKLHLKILKQSDDLFKFPNPPAVVGNIRAQVIQDMVKEGDADEFPFQASFEHRQEAAHEILQQISLTSEERAQIQAVYALPTP